MRATTLKASPASLGGLLAYYGGLADDQARRDGAGRGPVDYYLDPAEPPGRWWGHGCAALGLDGEVQSQQLEALLSARHPGTGARLGRGFGAKSARAFDATFSAPKSVSVLWALSPDAFVRAEVLAAHDVAVQAALDWFERHGAVARRGPQGVDQVDSQGVAVALFRQHTSRSADPQLHTHAIVAAKVQDPTGTWLSLDARFLKRQQRTIGWVYAAALRGEAVAGEQRLVLVVGPAGAGKTTALGLAARLLADQGRPVLGLAPSGKAADVLATETGWPAVTVAKLLHEHNRPGGPAPAWRLPVGTSVVLDEASMTSTDDLDALVGLVQRHRWRLVCVGDPAQLPAVGRGGVLALLCERLAAHHLEEVRRFADDWQATASLALRRGDAAGVAAYAEHHRLQSVHPALVADRVARQFERLAARGQGVAITTASAGTARAINVAIQHRRNPRRAGDCAELADGTAAFVGDRVATRRNLVLVTDKGSPVRNRQSWTVTAVVEDGSLVVVDPERGSVRLPASYVARYVELGWAVTGYGTQGITTDHAIAVVEPSSTRAGIYVAMTRGRDRNLAWIVDRTGLADPEDALAAAIARPPNAQSAHAVAARLGGEPSVPAVEPVVEGAVEEDAASRMRRHLHRPPAPIGRRGLSL